MQAYAYRWGNEQLIPIYDIERIATEDLLCIDSQKEMAMKNISVMLSGLPALNMLLWGERGCGKSALIKMLLHEYHECGLRGIEFSQDDVKDIYLLYNEIRKSDRCFLIFFDDVSFDKNDREYRKFKSIIQGGLENKPSNCIFVATSNKRHMINESAADTADIYERDRINEQASLFARFGLALGFYPMTSQSYLQIAGFYLDKFKIERYTGWEKDAEAFSIDRGGRSGRIAKQYAVYTNVTRSSVKRCVEDDLV